MKQNVARHRLSAAAIFLLIATNLIRKLCNIENTKHFRVNTVVRTSLEHRSLSMMHGWLLVLILHVCVFALARDRKGKMVSFTFALS